MSIRIFLFEVVLVVTAAMVIPRMLYIRFNRQAFLRKYKLKPGVLGYKKFTRMADARVISAVCVVTVPIVIKTVFDAYAIMHAHGRLGVITVWVVVGIVLLATLLILNAVLDKLKDE